jgi:hypothetical protein
MRLEPHLLVRDARRVLARAVVLAACSLLLLVPLALVQGNASAGTVAMMGAVGICPTPIWLLEFAAARRPQRGRRRWVVAMWLACPASIALIVAEVQYIEATFQGGPGAGAMALLEGAIDPGAWFAIALLGLSLGTPVSAAAHLRLWRLGNWAYYRYLFLLGLPLVCLCGVPYVWLLIGCPLLYAVFELGDRLDRWVAGLINADTAALWQQVDAGFLDLPQLRLLARLGHEPAREVLVSDGVEEPPGLVEWLGSLGPVGALVRTRVGIVILRQLSIEDPPLRDRVMWLERELTAALPRARRRGRFEADAEAAINWACPPTGKARPGTLGALLHATTRLTHGTEPEQTAAARLREVGEVALAQGVDEGTLRDALGEDLRRWLITEPEDDPKRWREVASLRHSFGDRQGALHAEQVARSLVRSGGAVSGTSDDLDALGAQEGPPTARR